jgi:hypothetical protein
VAQTKRPVLEEVTTVLGRTQAAVVAGVVVAEAVVAVVAVAVAEAAVVVVAVMLVAAEAAVVVVVAEAAVVVVVAEAVVVAANPPMAQPQQAQEAVGKRRTRVSDLAFSPCSPLTPLPPSIRANVLWTRSDGPGPPIKNPMPRRGPSPRPPTVKSHGPRN